MSFGQTGREMRPVFRNLLSPEFEADVTLAGTNEALYSMLASSAEVRDLRQSLRTEEVSDEEVRQFANTLLHEFRPGVLFPYDIVLAAIAVALGNWRTPFATEYISDLARLRSAEFRRAIAVARIANRQRDRSAKTLGRSMILGTRTVAQSWRLITPRRDECLDSREEFIPPGNTNAETRVFSCV